MTALVQFHKADTTERSTASTSAAEETNYTVSWSDLTTAGFANGDAVAIIVKCRFRGSTAAVHVRSEVSVGSSFAGATNLPNTLSDREPSSTSRNSPYMALGTETLATNDNIYFRKWVSSGTAYYDDFDIWVIKTADLGSNYQVATSNPSGNAPASDTDGASLSLPAGNWWCFAMSQWLDDDAIGDARMLIDVGGTDVAEVRYEGEDTANTINLGTEAFVALGSTTTVKIQYAVDVANSHDCEWTALHALNLDAFADSWGSFTNSTTSPAATATWYEYEGNNSFTLSATGDVMALGFYTSRNGNAVGSSINRVTLDGSAWPNANWCNVAGLDNGTSTSLRAPNFTVGYGNKTAGTYDFAFEYNEDASTGATTDVIDERSACIFSLELASSISAAITGTATASITEADVVAGGKTIIITLTGDTWLAAGTGPIGSTANTQAIIDGISAASSPALGWNDEWRDKEVTTAVVRTSNTVCTITMSSQATISGSYNISSTETITVTVPAAAVDGGSPVVATPTFTVSATVTDVFFHTLHRIEFGMVALTASGLNGVLQS